MLHVKLLALWRVQHFENTGDSTDESRSKRRTSAFGCVLISIQKAPNHFHYSSPLRRKRSTTATMELWTVARQSVLYHYQILILNPKSLQISHFPLRQHTRCQLYVSGAILRFPLAA